VLATTFGNFQHGGHEPEIVISHHTRHSAGPYKSHAKAFAHDKSKGMHADSARQLITHRTDDGGSSNSEVRAVRRRRRAAAAEILLTPPPPIVTDRRAAAAADQMSASRRRRFRDVFTSCCTPAIIMLLDFCNAVYNEA